MNSTSPIVQETHYDPWGLELTGIGFQYRGIKENRYLYQGKELLDDLNLNIYDFHARGYDPVIGRTWQFDPHAENYPSMSPYSWVANNPLSVVDPTGMDTVNVSTLNMQTFNPDVDVAGLGEVTVTASRIENGGETDSDNANLVLTAGGAIYGGLEGAAASQGYWLGENGKYYPQRWGGNQHTGSRAGALRAANAYRLAGRATVIGSIGVGAYSTREGYKLDGGEFGYNAQRAAAGSTGSILGGLAGAAAGAFVGAWVGGVGAIPGAVIGGVVGGFGLGIGGSYVGGQLGEKAVDHLHKPKQK
ncbi:RHS repeat-associated core domain-containing protein [Lunatibacter salilacus]|uniref:RHS repeat-associated core domain-containing protein n=1 Tax=Lunatibacter salilacus TaxID=2483804 RepID=UPI00131D91DD|nr:RHS repeat-associated core domain-containing protein [Lunatibacter salilacus]